MKIRCPHTNELCTRGCTQEVCSASSSLLKYTEEETSDAPVPIQTGMVGWICPRCGKGNSPWSVSCPCVQVPYPNYPINPYPSYPYYPNYPTIVYGVPNFYVTSVTAGNDGSKPTA